MEPDNNSFINALRTGMLYSAYSNKYEQPVPFKIGDKVVLKSGTAPQRVLEVNTKTKQIRCEYLNSRKQLGFRSYDDYQLYEYVTPYEEETEMSDIMKDKLFKTVKDARFGTGLAIDSDGKYVLKMQDSGTFESFDVTDLKRVMPYTFDVEFVGEASRGRKYSYRGKEGSVKVNDLLILSDTFSIVRVVAVNTESESATKVFNGVKIVTEEL